jgi:hypothetical protein
MPHQLQQVLCSLTNGDSSAQYGHSPPTASRQLQRALAPCRDTSDSQPGLLGRSFRSASGPLRAAATASGTAAFTSGHGGASLHASRKPLAKLVNAAAGAASQGGAPKGGVSRGAGPAERGDGATFQGLQDMLGAACGACEAPVRPAGGAKGSVLAAAAGASGPDDTTMQRHLAAARSFGRVGGRR